MNNHCKRMWINQPSIFQPLHKLHGTNVLAQLAYFDMWGMSMTIYFLSGNTISMIVPDSVLSEGWK